jgi:DNA ligase 4
MEVVIDQRQLRISNELFQKPFAVELMGAGFDRPGDVNYWTLQFPWIQKIHDDRTWKDVISFFELQDIARECQHPPPENVDQGKKLWLARLHGPIQQAQNADSIISQETSECSASSESQVSLDEDQPAQVRTRTTSLEIADSQPDNMASSSVVSV